MSGHLWASENDKNGFCFFTPTAFSKSWYGSYNEGGGCAGSNGRPIDRSAGDVISDSDRSQNIRPGSSYKLIIVMKLFTDPARSSKRIGNLRRVTARWEKCAKS